MKVYCASALAATLIACVSTPPAAEREPANVVHETMSVIRGNVDLALCRSAKGDRTIEERTALLDEAVASLRAIVPRLPDVERARARAELDELVGVDARARADVNFWDRATSCPRRLNAPDVRVEIPGGLNDALARARRYRRIALCAEKGSYSINDRLGFLDASAQLFEIYVSASSGATLPLASAELRRTEALRQAARTEGLDFWDVGSTCPKTRAKRD